MGLPEINIQFQTLAASAVKRSSKGIVALILKDNTKTFDTMIYTGIDEVKAEDWSAKNKDYISKAFLGSPTKVIIERIAVEAIDYNVALGRLKNKKWNYLAIPGIQAAEVADIATWIKTQRSTYKKSYKAVLPHCDGDHEGIINFDTEDLGIGSTTYTTAEYCARIAGIMAGIPYTRSSTNYVLSEVTSIKESTTPNEDIDAGKLILINDGEHIKIGRGVNSLKTTSTTKSAKFKKIKIIEAIDQMRDDIRKVWDEEYSGKVNNFYTNKMLFVAAVNGYFRSLQRDEVLDPDFNATADIDTAAQKSYLKGLGVAVDTMNDAQIRRYNTGEKTFIKASGSPLDAMEDLDFSMSIV